MISETEKDICMNAGYLIAKGKIVIHDSREFINSVVPDLAKEFEQSYDSEEDYIIQIDEFTDKKLVELYGE